MAPTTLLATAILGLDWVDRGRSTEDSNTVKRRFVVSLNPWKTDDGMLIEIPTSLEDEVALSVAAVGRSIVIYDRQFSVY